MRRRNPVLGRSLAATAAGLALGAVIAAVGAPSAGATPLGRTSPRAAATCPSSGGVTIAEAPAPLFAGSGPEISVYGHGWGHGMGMSQYGAQGAARLGCSYRTILDTYYTGTSLVSRTLSAPVLLALGSAASSATLEAETGSVRWSSGVDSAVQPAASTWQVRPRSLEGRSGLALLDAEGDQQLFVAEGALLSARHTGTVVTVRPSGGSSLRTRWDTARFVAAGAGIAVTEEIDSGQGYSSVQKYLMGLAEVPVRWPAEALKAQAVAARTYLIKRYSSTRGGYLLGTGTADQVYRGYEQEQKDAALGGGWRQAVVATAGQVIVDSTGHTIDAMYSSSTGGYTENRQYVYGRYPISYLQAVDDSRWDAASDNPYRSWSRAFSAASFADRFGFDSVSSFSIARRGSTARVDGVQITGIVDGASVTRSFTGTQARSRLGLKSPGFVFGSSVAVAKATRRR